ncbi:Thoeris anti-defense Tad2 family protein [Xenorhabdus thailandensis]|uniref:Thoeris anti-defense Tad2 family protein n=1 Tax=Xenorhabdus thailandensis TaxID=3136255 RepID=UPI0030F3BBD5
MLIKSVYLTLNNTNRKLRLIIDIAAPEGSFPWAMIKAYLGNKVYRSNWDFPVEYIRLAGIPDNDPYIEKHKPENTTSWNPAQKDLVACDWQVMCPDDSMLSFDLTLGTRTYGDDGVNTGSFGQDWGYMTNKGQREQDEQIFGTLTTDQKNKTDIANVLSFFWEERVHLGTSETLRFRVSSSKANYQNMLNLMQKALSVIVDGVSYHVGVPTSSSYPTNDNINDWYTYTAYYRSDDAQKLSTILKQRNTIKTFCFNWK